MAELSHSATLGSKVKPDLWAQWRKKYNDTLIEFETGNSRVTEGVTFRETHKLVVPIAGGAREQYISIEFVSKVEVNAPHTADGILQAQEIAREVLTHTQLEWADAVRDRILDYAKENLKQG